jgi:hypothetical protein
LQKAAQADNDRGEVQEAEIDVTVALEANTETAEAVEPGGKSFYLPTVRRDFRVRPGPGTTFLARFDSALGNTVADPPLPQVVTKCALPSCTKPR